MSPTSDVNAFTGTFPPTSSLPLGSGAIANRLQVHDTDLDPAANEGALYFVQVQQVHPQDAAAGNADNNASFTPVTIAYSPTQGRYNLSIAGPTQAERSVIHAWYDNDPFVLEKVVRVPGEGTFLLSARVTDLGTGFWHYEYALQNLNSHRSAGSFSICFLPGTIVENVGFHGVDYHSGEPYDSTDWTVNVGEGGVTWSTQSYTANPNANALRWGTLYNFRFDADAPPEPTTATISLFRPGDPSSVQANTFGPQRCRNDLDADGDGQPSCFDHCPDTPTGTCTCQGIGMCCFGCTGPCLSDYPRDTCVEVAGTPDECGDPRCKKGCPLLDMDNDGDRDLADFAGLQRCFSGAAGAPGFVVPTQECLKRLDTDDNYAIDLGDYGQLFDLGLLGE